MYDKKCKMHFEVCVINIADLKKQVSDQMKNWRKIYFNID
jgi:hypothetical protein